MSSDSEQPVHPKHTPRPWHFHKHYGVMSHGERNDFGEPIPVATEVRYEDGPLISAAPDMYEALSAIENDDGSIPPAIWKMRNNALAKARGEL